MMHLKHGHISLVLHELQSGRGLPLLLLHQLRGSSADWELPLPWEGPVHALDFSGHGDSARVAGGGYYPELLVADADAALAHLERAAVAGAGLGAYVALMLAGARPQSVAAALLLPGAGLAGAGPAPDYEAPFPDVDSIAAGVAGGFDPFVELLESFVRPASYTQAIAAAAQRVLLADDDEGERPPWWASLRGGANVEVVVGDVGGALISLSAAARD